MEIGLYIVEDRDSETELPTLQCLSPGFQTQQDTYQNRISHGKKTLSELAQQPTEGLGIPWHDQSVWWQSDLTDESDVTSQADPVARANRPS